MSDHLFGWITLPPELDQLVEFHRFHVDHGSGSASLLDGWRAFLRHLLTVGPMEFLSAGCEHLEHLGDHASDAVDELIGSPWSEVVSLGIAMQSLRFSADLASHGERSGQPRWLSDVERRRVVQASVRDESAHRGPTPWIVELDFGRALIGCITIWINPDGSLHQLYPSDESIEEAEEFLGEINHLVPNRPFTRVPPAEALSALGHPAEHSATAPGDRAMLQWLLRTKPITESA